MKPNLKLTGVRAAGARRDEDRVTHAVARPVERRVMPHHPAGPSNRQAELQGASREARLPVLAWSGGA